MLQGCRIRNLLWSSPRSPGFRAQFPAFRISAPYASGSFSRVDLTLPQFVLRGWGAIALTHTSLSSLNDFLDPWHRDTICGHPNPEGLFRLREVRPCSHIMSGNDVNSATDNNPYLQYKRKLGSGGWGTVHEVLLRIFNELTKIYDIHGRKVRKRFCRNAHDSHSQGNCFTLS